MSSYVQSSPATERNEVVWRPMYSSKSYPDTFASDAPPTPPKTKHAAYATSIAARHSTNDKQALSHASHLNDDLHSPFDRQQSTHSDRLSFASHSRKDLALKSSDASFNIVTSSLKNNKPYLKERNAPKEPSVDLTKANFYHKKPPILSPKPNILPKQKKFAEFSPNATDDRNQSSAAENLERASEFSNPVFPKDVSRKASEENRSVYRGRSQSVEDESVFETSNQIFQTAKVEQPKVSRPVKRSQTLPRPYTENVRKTGMETATIGNNSTVEKFAVKSPPKIPAKPKLKPSLTSPGNRFSNGRSEPDKNLNQTDFDDPSSLIPFSAMRTKFEDMKIKFKKPMPEPKFNSTPVIKSNSSERSDIAEELFKDILQMKTLDHFESEPPQKFGEPQQRNSATQPVHHCGTRVSDTQEMKYVPASKNLSNYNQMQSNAKQTNSLFSTTDKSRTSGSYKPVTSPKFKPNHSKYNPIDIPAPNIVKNEDLHQIDFMDLPPPPELPPNCDQCLPNKAERSDATKPSAAHLERNSATHGNAAYHHSDRQPIAPGLAKHNMHSNETMNFRKESKSFANNNQSSQLLGKPVKAENPSNRRQSNESDPNKASIHNDLSRFDENSTSFNVKITKSNSFLENHSKDAKFSVAAAPRSFEEEILYYDNMDIMEKVSKKREQDELRLKKLENQHKTLLPPKKIQEQAAKENKRPTPHISPTPLSPSAKPANTTVSEKSKVLKHQNETHKTAANYEKEYFKEKDGNKELASGPPKLPPKQLKFNRKLAFKTAEEHLSPVAESQQHQSDSKDPNHQPLRIQIESSPTRASTTPHVATPMPTEASPSFNVLSPSQNQQQSARPQPPLLAPQMTPEDARARQLVDEPLAPIMEEDSTYGDSSSCASSITGDDASVFTETSSVFSPYLLSSSNLSTQAKLGFRHTKPHLYEDDQDEGTTETDSTFAEKDSINSSSSSIDDDSDTTSVQWQENPLQTNQPVSNVLSSNINGPASVGKTSVETSQKQQRIHQDAQNVRSIQNKHQFPRESRSAESSGSGTNRFSSKSSEEIEDVAPYGMVDLSKLEPSFQTQDSHTSSQYSNAELTPSSIMYSVNQFNATHPKSPTKSGSFSFDEAPDTPTAFPLKVEVGEKQTKTSKLPPKKLHQRSKSDAEPRFVDEEQPGYDNLENYGGEARKTAEQKKKIREASLPAKYTLPLSPQSNDTTKKKSLERGDSRDSLSSEPGLAHQAAGSRASFPLPATEARLARHSSAVRAVDKHSGNLKRAKESGALDSFHKPSSNRITDKTPPQSATLPRKHVDVVDGKTTANPGRSQAKESPMEHKRLHQATAQKYEVEDRLPSDFDERQDDAIANPYEEVPFIPRSGGDQVIASPPVSPEQVQVKSKVKEIMENMKSPESLYRPKPPVPRYPVEYDNFYLDKDSPTPSKANNSAIESAGKNRSAPNSATPVSSPVANDKKFDYAPVTPNSTPALSRTTSSRTSRSNKSDHESNVSIPSQDEDASHNVSDTGSRSLGSQLRYLLGGGQDSKHVSPSVRRKRSLLKRSKSPGGSRRSKSPSKSIGTAEEHSSSSGSAIKPGKKTSNDEQDISKNESSKSSETESRENIPLRSASQRLVDRRGRAASQRAKTSEEESSGQTLERRKKDKLRMSSRWRRSKSQDRGESPARSKSKERRIFGRRSKSQERSGDKDSRDAETGDEERSGRKFLRRSRSSSRKRDKRERSSERTEDGNSSGGRGRNPVKFLRKLLRSKKGDEDIEIIHSTFDKAGDLTDSTEALSTILAYKGEEATETEEWKTPRPNPPQQRSNKAPDKKSKQSPTGKANKALRSPPSHRAKKFTSAHVAKTRPELSTGSSSEGIDKRKSDRSKMTPTHGSGRSRMSPPQKPMRVSSRKSSFSNSIHSSDSEPFIKHDDKRMGKTSSMREDVGINRNQFPLKPSAALRRNLLNRDYDSDTATSVLASDADSSAGPQSDFDGNNSSHLRPVLKPRKGGHQLQTRNGEVPKRPVRIMSPKRSKSDPSIFPGTETSQKDHANTYYNFEEDNKSQTTTNSVEKKRPVKTGPNRRRNQKQTRRQTAPVDLAYEAHQRQKYKTLVSLNSQTLRKVTEKWLSEWRNQLPVGGFLITSWSDVALSSHRPMCMIGNSVVYSAVSTGNKQFHLACQLYDHADVDDRMIRKLDNCSSLPAHPNTCGVCSHFNCRVPRSLLDPSSGGGAADAVCVVLTTRPYQSLQDFLDRVARQEEATELHRQVLVNILQLLQGIKHLQSSGFDLPYVSAEHLVITEDRGFLQILPHLYCSDPRGHRNVGMDSCQSSDSDSNFPLHQRSITQQVGSLMKMMLHNGSLATTVGSMVRPGERRSTSSNLVVPGTKFSSAIKHIIRHLQTTTTLSIQESTQIIQCALWGPEDLEDVGVDDVSPYAALELWIEMEQAKLVNSLAVLASNDRLVPVSFLKHQYFASVTPQTLFNGLKVLQRI